MASRGGLAPKLADTPYQQEQDAWQRQLEKGVALALGQSLIERKLLTRRCNDLTLDDLIGIGVDACAEYARLRELRRAEEAARGLPSTPI